MTPIGFEQLLSEIKTVKPVRAVGRITGASGGVITVSGLGADAAIGDLVEIGDTETPRLGEVLQLNEKSTVVLPDSGSDGLSIGLPVYHIGNNMIAPDASWLGQVIDPFGVPMSDTKLFPGKKPLPVRGAPPNPTQRRGLGERMESGLAVFNTLLPIVRGQRIGLFAGSGVGKSTLLAKLATGLKADVVVIAMVGERGREIQEFVDRILGPKAMKRAIVVAASSDQSPLVRRRCPLTAMAIAEYFRDEGKQVLLLADSITRFAEAHREVALATGEPSSLRGFPPSTSHQITALCERAGPGTEESGDITAVFSVLVAGSDMEEPIADIMRGVLDGHIVLDRQIAERGRFPAIDLLRSVSRSLPAAASPSENELISSARRLLGIYDRTEMMIQAGLYNKGSDPNVDAAIECWPHLDKFLSLSEPDDIQASFQRLKDCIDISSDSAAQ